MKTNELYDVENPGELLDVDELQSRLEKEIAAKNVMLESQIRMAARIKKLEQVLWDVLELYKNDRQQHSMDFAWNVLKEKI